MSVRRLAEPALQPASFAFNRANAAWAKQAVKKYPKGREQSAVIPLLMRAQEQEGWVTKAAIEHVAEMLDMPMIRVLEVATFYTQYQLKPVGTRAHVQVCGTTPCMLRGSEALMQVCRSKIHPEQFHTNDAGTLSWEEVECLGACVNAPMVMIFKDTFEDLTPERLEGIIDAFEKGGGTSVPSGPQNGRIYSAPVTGLTSLTDEKAVLKSTRDKAARADVRQAKADAATVAPSRAGRPSTDAAETSPALKSPSPVKASPAAEQAASVKGPAYNGNAADRADPAVETSAKQRTHPHRREDAPKAFEQPGAVEGKPVGPAGKRRAGEPRAPVGEPSPETPTAETAPSGPAAGSAAAPSGRSRPGTGVAPQPSERNRPAGIERPEHPDDLTLISGVGPKIQAMLNSLGIYSFAQVASWKKAERDWVDGYLNFRGRVERDDWSRQAKALAKGGVAEYIRVFGKKPR